ncbi:hypothetical protein EIMP300_35320 [Escherichia coli]|uniref:HTH lysR-type domain-containing protein n=1 Tax=Escherichia coli TaxID=562 RepID=A0A8S0FPK5_ECOLX|nr:hypothetical protein EIMP300_35320 [Escherichia coli]
MNYSLKQLKVFVTVAQEKSFSRAGERIGLSQSAVSHSVKELENHTGVRLLDRTTREVALAKTFNCGCAITSRVAYRCRAAVGFAS